MTCPRKAYYEYERGIKPIKDKEAFRFGKAWHLAMERKWIGDTPELASQAVVDTAVQSELDEKLLATVSGLLVGYYRLYDGHDVGGERFPEIEFAYDIPGSLTFKAAGKIDCLWRSKTDTIMIEHKTTGEDISDTSQYWSRLRFNPQLFQYYLGAKTLGYDVDRILFDVVKKPGIKVKSMMPCLDEQGKKIVLDSNGERVYKKNGEPKESSDAKSGHVLQTREETLEEYSQRLAEDCIARPEYYFARREVPVLIQDLESFVDQRIEVGRQILYYRQRERKVGITGWPRNCQYWTCNQCQYAGFCLSGMALDEQNLPDGFEVRKINEELEIV
jgi:hypothetical protein